MLEMAFQLFPTFQASLKRKTTGCNTYPTSSANTYLTTGANTYLTMYLCFKLAGRVSGDPGLD